MCHVVSVVTSCVDFEGSSKNAFLLHKSRLKQEANQKQVSSKIVILWPRHFFYVAIKVSNKVVDETNKVTAVMK